MNRSQRGPLFRGPRVSRKKMTRTTRKTRGGGKAKLCALCKADLVASPYPDLLIHTESTACSVVITDALGVCVDDSYELVDGEIYAREAPVAAVNVPVSFGGAMFINGVAMSTTPEGSGYVGADFAMRKLFESIDKPYLGGSSGSRGWSSVSTYQRCRYLWKDKYGSGKSVIDETLPGPEALEVGALVHLFLAIHYLQRIDVTYPVDPEAAKRFLELQLVTPAVLEQAWSLFDAYRAFWGAEEWMRPLAVEELALDPRTGFSCRWDLVFEVLKPFENMLPGVYVCNSKTASKNDIATRDGWQNDGQILGEMDLFNRLGYHKRFGPLRGNCINLIIKTKVPQFFRQIVLPQKRVLNDHHRTLKIFDAEMRLAEATGLYPRSRAACITRYGGLCELFQHCAGVDDDSPREIES